MDDQYRTGGCVGRQAARRTAGGEGGKQTVQRARALGLRHRLGFGPRRPGGPGDAAPAATAAHLALVWGTEQVMLPALRVAPPAPQRGAKELAVDGWHHLVYAGVTGAAYELLDHSR